jgi:hypothetical protein
MSTNRPRAILALIGALLIWSALSYAFISMFAGGGVCSLLQTAGPGSTPHQLTQAEMDAQVAARCNRPNIGTLMISGAGYVMIVAVGLVQVTAGKPQPRGNP